MTTELYNRAGALLYTAVPRQVPGNHVCLVDEDMNQLTVWAVIGLDWKVRWDAPPLRPGLAVGLLVRTSRGRVIHYDAVAVPVRLDEQSTPIELAVDDPRPAPE